MDAVEFLKATKRMCEANIKTCQGCPLFDSDGGCSFTIITEGNENIAVDIVERWAKEHPVKTRQSEFLKMYPNVSIDVRDGIILLSPCALDIKIQEGVECQDNDCAECRKNYWLQEIQEEE